MAQSFAESFAASFAPSYQASANRNQPFRLAKFQQKLEAESMKSMAELLSIKRYRRCHGTD